MYLLAESGSTKTDWCEFDHEKVIANFRTSGINPDIAPEEVIERQLREGFTNNLYYRKPEVIYFYGAGLAGKHNRELIAQILHRIFPEAQPEVHHDLLAAARATCADQPGIVCILGTGSNSCAYDGRDITREIGGHGYLFGDEGSGADLGKALMKRVLDNDLPPDIITQLEDWIGLKALQIRKEIHQAHKPNVYLARISRFLHENLDKPVLKDIVRDRFAAFLKTTVLRYPEFGKVKVHFVGSIAHFYRELLEEVCLAYRVDLGSIIKGPVEKLVQYHIAHL